MVHSRHSRFCVFFTLLRFIAQQQGIISPVIELAPLAPRRLLIIPFSRHPYMQQLLLPQLSPYKLLCEFCGIKRHFIGYRVAPTQIFKIIIVCHQFYSFLCFLILTQLVFSRCVISRISRTKKRTTKFYQKYNFFVFKCSLLIYLINKRARVVIVSV